MGTYDDSEVDELLDIAGAARGLDQHASGKIDAPMKRDLVAVRRPDDSGVMVIGREGHALATRTADLEDLDITSRIVAVDLDGQTRPVGR